MDAITARRLGNIALAIALIILVAAIGGRVGLLPQIAHIRELALVALFLAVIARVLRRRGRDMAGG